MIVEPVWIALLEYFGAGSSMTIMLFILPAMIELRKPKDAGPRILGDFGLASVFGVFADELSDLEESQDWFFALPTEKTSFMPSILDLEA
jgi:hypothetical protein